EDEPVIAVHVAPPGTLRRRIECDFVRRGGRRRRVGKMHIKALTAAGGVGTQFRKIYRVIAANASISGSGAVAPRLRPGSRSESATIENHPGWLKRPFLDRVWGR